MKKTLFRERNKMSSLDVDKIYNHIPKVNYKGVNSDKEYKKLLEGKNEKESI